MEIKKGILEQLDENENWVGLHPETDADLVKYKDLNVADKLDELDARSSEVETERVRSLNDQFGDVEILGIDNVDINTIGNSITVSGNKLATKVEVNKNLAELRKHTSDFNNPHEVTKDQLGLGEVDNTSDLDKPISKAQAEKNELLDAEDANIHTEIINRYNTLDSRITSVRDTLDDRITDEVNILNEKDESQDSEIHRIEVERKAEDTILHEKDIELKENIDSDKLELQTNIDSLSADVYHKEDIKAIALSGKSEDVTINKIDKIHSTNLQEALEEIAVIERTGTIVKAVELETPEAGFKTSYAILQDDVQSGVTVNIPFGYELTSGETVIEDGQAKLRLTLTSGEDTKTVDIELSNMAKMSDVESKVTAAEENLTSQISSVRTDLNAEISSLDNKKQDKLTAGTGIEIISQDNNLVINNTKDNLEWGKLVGNITDQADLKSALDEKETVANVAILISNEEERANDAEVALGHKIENEETRAKEAELNLSNDINTAKEEVTNLINVETERAETAEQSLANDINTVSDNLATEILDRQTAITETENKIEAEATRAEAAEESLDNAIKAEETRATGVEAELLSAINAEAASRQFADTQFSEDLTSETQARTLADNNLLGKVETEETRAKESEATIASNLSAETGRATDAETTLDNKITALDTSFHGELSAEIARAEAAENTITETVNTNIEDISNIKSLIPVAATKDNQLADKTFVRDAIEEADAEFKGTFTDLEELKATPANKNDFAYYDHIAAGNRLFDKYKYTTEWKYEYSINNSSFTSEQWAAINSGITSAELAAILADIVKNSTAIQNETAARETADLNLTTHKNDYSNPHQVTKAQVGLGNVDNTSDINKPISIAQQDALGLKVDKVDGKELSTNDFTDELKLKLDNISANAKKVEKSNINGNIKIDGEETTVYTEVEHTVHDADYKHIDVTDTSVTDGTNTFNKYAHPTTDQTAAAAVKVGKDELGHVVLGNALEKSDVGLGNVDNTSDADKPISTAQQTALNKKVDKIDGKGLSANDFTDTLKSKLDGIAAGAEVNVQSDWNQTSTSADDYIKNKPTKLSQFNNDTNYVNETQLATKVDKVNNKGLIDNTELSKLNGTINNSKDINVSKINAPSSSGSSNLSYGSTNQILTAAGDGTAYWRDSYSAGSGIEINNTSISITYSSNCLISTENWTAVTTTVEEEEVVKYYEADIPVAGISETAHPILDILIDKEQYEDIDDINEAWSLIYSAETYNGGIKFYAKELPEKNLNIQIKGY